MSGDEAVRLAIELIHMPSQVRAARAAALPDGVLQVLSIAAGDERVQQEIAARLGRPEPLVRQASAFFIEQVLLAPGTDSYRVLGASRSATQSELRRNMALLLRGLHPDHDPNGERSMFANRVVKAWEDLKTPERRQSYDARSGDAPRQGAPRARPQQRAPSRQLVLAAVAASRPTLWQRFMMYLLGVRR